jgi:Flp pilus assembly protein TadB
MKLEINKERFKKDAFKEELLASHTDPKYTFKDVDIIKNFKAIVNSTFVKHFDTTAQVPEGRSKFRSKNPEPKHKGFGKITTRFDAKKSKRRKLSGLFSDFVMKLGYEYSARDLNSKILRYTSAFCSLLTLFILVMVIYNAKSLDTLIIFTLIIWTLVFAAAYLALLFIVFTYLDVRMHNYVRQIEEALPDFLQLASSNISAGMTIDRALWYAVRPKFGILAKEMEDVAKSTIAGEDLEKALVKLGSKYDSRVLKETINLIVEGISSGGEMAVLVDKLATNIKETQLMRKEISASVTTYAIFIGVATVAAAPILFALSTELLLIMQKIFSSIHMDSSVGSSSMFSFNFSGESISIANFQRFAIMVLVISSFFSAAIISVIKKGSVKDGLKTIPTFIIISLILYFAAAAAFKYLLGGMF